MKNLITHTFLLALFALPLSVLSQEQDANAHQQEKKEATEAAEAWLKLVDAGKAEKSWNETSDFFKKNVSLEDWKKLVKGTRKPLGKLNTRAIFSQQYYTQLPAAPDGEYVIVQFKSSFENKKEATETVTPSKVNGEWKVTGYFIN